MPKSLGGGIDGSNDIFIAVTPLCHVALDFPVNFDFIAMSR
jgi:hypothetical protein